MSKRVLGVLLFLFWIALVILQGVFPAFRPIWYYFICAGLAGWFVGGLCAKLI